MFLLVSCRNWLKIELTYAITVEASIKFRHASTVSHAGGCGYRWRPARYQSWSDYTAEQGAAPKP
jgi:hypothetical protein